MAQLAAPMNAPPAKTAARAPPRQIVQARLEVGPAQDHFEREADRVAASVMSSSSAPVSIPPTITPIGARRKTEPVRKEEEWEGQALDKSVAQRKAADGKSGRARRDAAAGAQGGTASASVDSAIQAMRSGPAPGLDASTRSFMEGRFGRDFGDVRVHHGAPAAQAAEAVGARAFTTGNDIFFNRGQYQPNSSGGRRLIAHELTHTVQQKGAGGTAARKRIQRNGPAPPPTREPVPPNRELTFTLDNGGPNRTGKLKLAAQPLEVELPYLNLPMVNQTLKGMESPTMSPRSQRGDLPMPRMPYSVQGTTPRRGSATTTWLDGARRGGFQAGVGRTLSTKLRQQTSAPTSPPANVPFQMPNDAYVLGFENGFGAERRTFVWGTLAELARSELVLIPRWAHGASSAELTMDVDHILELQLGGADTFDNMWLLESRYNQRTGALISGRITSELTEAVRDVRRRYDLGSITLPGAAEIRERWKVTFLDQRQGPRMDSTEDFWTREDIQAGRQLGRLKFLTSEDLDRRGFTPRTTEGTPSRIYIFPTPYGGMMRPLTVTENRELRTPTPADDLYPNIELWGGRLERPGSGGDKIATIEVLWMRARRTPGGSPMRRNGEVVRDPVPRSVDLMKLPGFYDVGYISRSSVYEARTGWGIPDASPVEFSEIGLNTGGYLVGSGSLTATKALLPGLRADVQMLPTELRIDFPIPRESFSLGPVTVTALTMSLGINDSGPFVRGIADFVVSSLGVGSLTAEVSSAGPVIAGQFDLAMDFLNPARIEVSYNFANDTFLAEATLGVQSGRIPGVDSGQVTVRITRDAIGVSGTLSLGGPLRGTVVNVTYNQTDGLRIGADNIPLPLNRIPAIQNATLSISATRSPEGAWSFAGTGTATLAVPGATGTISISYLDGAITFTANAQVARGPASGTLNFTATNRALDEEGRPVEGPPTGDINVWGRGSVTVRFGNILTGTAGIELTPDNRVIISGSIGLPPAFELFPRRDYVRDLFTLSPPEFPIWGVSVAGVGVGIFAFVDARVAFNAYVGPGEIRDAQVGATLDLDRPEDATVTGRARFVVPAYAGLSLDVGGGLRARLAVAYAEGRVGLTGALGVQAGASAEIDIAWNRTDGLELGADLRAEARPKFELSANASVTVGVHLLVTDVSRRFGPWRRALGSFGPDMTLGVRMPVRWSEAEGLDLSLENIEVQRPSLDASALMTSVFERLAA